MQFVIDQIIDLISTLLTSSKTVFIKYNKANYDEIHSNYILKKINIIKLHQNKIVIYLDDDTTYYGYFISEYDSTILTPDTTEEQIFDFYKNFITTINSIIKARRTSDELRKLNVSLNEEILEKNEIIMLKEQRQIASDLVEGIAHEVANPLSVFLANQEVIENSINLINNRLEAKDYQTLEKLFEQFKSIVLDQKEATFKLKSIFNDLRGYADVDVVEIEQIDLKNLIDETINLIQYKKKVRKQIINKVEPNIMISTLRRRLSQAIFHTLSPLSLHNNDQDDKIVISSELLDNGKFNIILNTKSSSTLNQNNLSFTLASRLIESIKGAKFKITDNSEFIQIDIII